MGPVLLTFEDRGAGPRILRHLDVGAPPWVHHAINLAAFGGQVRSSTACPPLPGPTTPALQGYKGWFTKPRVLHAWLDKHAATLADRLVIFIDGAPGAQTWHLAILCAGAGRAWHLASGASPSTRAPQGAT